jgi:hypothetical protein
MLSSHKLAADHKGTWEKAKEEEKGKQIWEKAKKDERRQER